MTRSVLAVLCLSFLFLTSCSKDEPVICDTGFTGENCNQYVTPASIRIKSVTFSQIPETDPLGQTWDFLLPDPDIFVKVLDIDGNLIYESDVVYNHAGSSITFYPAVKSSQYTGIFFLEYSSLDVDREMAAVSIGLEDFNIVERTRTYDLGSQGRITVETDVIF